MVISKSQPSPNTLRPFLNDYGILIGGRMAARSLFKHDPVCILPRDDNGLPDLKAIGTTPGGL